MREMSKKKLHINNEKEDKDYKTRIDLVYFANFKGFYPLLGKDFIELNKSNTELIVNFRLEELDESNKLKEGENFFTLIIKNKLINLSHMFFCFSTLKSISGLKYLDINQSKNFEYMFGDCYLLLDIKPLENWNVSNAGNFEKMFYFWGTLSDIKAFVSHETNFKEMFLRFSLSDIKALEN